ncbi:MAG: hypothetical protein J3Q66DRAFT_141758 [Benniella sp.]|nr:MAG: hypothetical protein J3Q66DRAFT_141758 [Benniella sp.]
MHVAHRNARRVVKILAPLAQLFFFLVQPPSHALPPKEWNGYRKRDTGSMEPLSPHFLSPSPPFPPAPSLLTPTIPRDPIYRRASIARPIDQLVDGCLS